MLEETQGAHGDSTAESHLHGSFISNLCQEPEADPELRTLLAELGQCLVCCHYSDTCCQPMLKKYQVPGAEVPGDGTVVGEHTWHASDLGVNHDTSWCPKHYWGELGITINAGFEQQHTPGRLHRMTKDLQWS